MVEERTNLERMTLTEEVSSDNGMRDGSAFLDEKKPIPFRRLPCARGRSAVHNNGCAVYKGGPCSRTSCTAAVTVNGRIQRLVWFQARTRAEPAAQRTSHITQYLIAFTSFLTHTRTPITQISQSLFSIRLRIYLRPSNARGILRRKNFISLHPILTLIPSPAPIHYFDASVFFLELNAAFLHGGGYYTCLIGPYSHTPTCALESVGGLFPERSLSRRLPMFEGLSVAVRACHPSGMEDYHGT